MANDFNDIVSISRKYEDMCRFSCWADYDKFMYLINQTHYTLNDNVYGNLFFPVSHNYHRIWKTAKEINEMIEANVVGSPKWSYNGASLGKYVRMGLMEVNKTTKPYLYTLPVDFFETNLDITFKK